MAIKLQGQTYKVGSVGLVETQGCFRPETEFIRITSTIAGGCTIFLIDKKIAITTSERLFLSRGILKTLPKIKHVLFTTKMIWH